VTARAADAQSTDDVAMVDDLARLTFAYFVHEVDRDTGLVRDSTQENAPATIAGSGLALTCYVVAAERGWLSRDDAAARTLATLRFFWAADQSGAPDGTGYRGFFYHFLDALRGRRVWHSELSTIDSAIVFAGALAAAEYFDRDAPAEREIRELAVNLYARADWTWTLRDRGAIAHGWTPKRGFLPHDWLGYNEALLVYVLALGSPTHPIPEAAYDRWLSTYRWKRLYGHEHVYGGPLFMHQLSHIWIDFREIADAFMREKGIDYFENSRRATYVQREYAIRNPRRFVGYGPDAWGVSASDGPGPASRVVRGIRRRFYDYRARGVPFGPDDGTLAPWAVAASLPFAPEIVFPALRYCWEMWPGITGKYGYKGSLNPSFTVSERDGSPWISSEHYAIDQGPIVLMIENYRSGLIWSLMRRCPYVAIGLRRAGFRGGWLNAMRHESS
jgi:hypothetical protein